MRVAVRPVPDSGAIGTGTVAVIIDVLRATTTLTVALGNGAAGVRPAVSPEEAFAAREGLRDALLCGERNGLMIPGFDLGNSPADYEPARVRDCTLVFSSTNGSRAMHAARRAKRRILGAFINAAAVIETVANESHVTLVCSGKNNRPAMEDLACAGWLLKHLHTLGAVADGPDARLALAIAPQSEQEVSGIVAGCAHARELRGLGPAYARDVEFCARLDVTDQAFEV